MGPIAIVIKADSSTTQAVTFEQIVPIHLPLIFTGYGPLPSVTGTQNQIGGWDCAGQTRTVHLSDGSSAQELLTKYEYPNYFSYTVSNFTGMLRFFATSAEGEWWFAPTPSGKTSIKWRYAFNVRSLVVMPVLWFITSVLWRGYMKKALALTITHVESNYTVVSIPCI